MHTHPLSFHHCHDATLTLIRFFTLYHRANSSPASFSRGTGLKGHTAVEMSQFFGKIMTWIANEVVVKTLANSKSFQRFALRTDTFARENLSKAQETITKTMKEGSVPPIVGGGASKAQTIRDEIDKMNLVDAFKFMLNDQSKVFLMKHHQVN